MKGVPAKRLPRELATFHGRTPRLALQVLHGLVISLIIAFLLRFVWIAT